MIHTHSRGEAEELEKEVWMEKWDTKINPDIFGYLGFDRIFFVYEIWIYLRPQEI